MYALPMSKPLVIELDRSDQLVNKILKYMH